MKRKKRLNLTVRDDFKEQAYKLAKLRRRSLSGLFEDLIEAEWKRLERTCEKFAALDGNGDGILSCLRFNEGVIA